MEIRRATVEDYERLKEIKLKAKGSEKRYNRSLKSVRENRSKYLSYLKSDLTDGRRAVFVAMEKDRAVGMITGRIYTTLPIRRFPRKGHISNLFVMPGHRRKGVAMKLVRALLGWFREEGIKDVHLGVFLKNKSALAMFRKLGFGEYAMEMKKRL